jgi:hypothetical protein
MSGYQMEDPNSFNNLINELMRMNIHQPSPSVNGSQKGKMAGKDRASSEKNQSTANSQAHQSNSRYTGTGSSGASSGP